MTAIETSKRVRRQIIISNVINTIYLVLMCLIAVLVRIGIRYCRNSTSALLDTVQNAEPDYIGGYAIIGGLLGAGTVTFFQIILYLVLIVILAYSLMFLVENIGGYRIYRKLKREEFSDKLAKSIMRNAALKIVLALLVIAPMLYFVFHAQWLAPLVLAIPQVIVLFLSVNSIRIMSDSGQI